MRYIYYFSLLFLCVLSACSVNDSPTNTGDNKNDNVIITTIAGIVNDEAGQPIPDATITVIDSGVVKFTATTSQFGSFMIQEVSVPSSRCFIICKKSGYFTGSRAEIPTVKGITEMHLTMQSNTPTNSVNATSGGKINVGTASVDFPANAFVTGSGTPYTGTVSIAAKFIDPNTVTFYDSFSGDMTATRTDGNRTDLLSYGVLRVQVKDAAGNDLKIATGKTATLSYPISASMQANAPASVPLWYFDEAIGMWKEEGAALKSGNTYTGKVSHFTDWNCDIPALTGKIKGRLVCSGNGEGISGIHVTVGQRTVVTNSDGYFSTRVPIDIALTISINAAKNNGMTSPDVNTSPLVANEERTLSDIQITNCPALLTGTVVDCASAPVAGTVTVKVNGKYLSCFTETGAFKMHVPSAVAMTAQAHMGEANSDPQIGLPVDIPILTGTQTYTCGNISACGKISGNADYFDFDLGSAYIPSVRLSPDGSLVVIEHFQPGAAFTDIYQVTTGQKVTSFKRYNDAPLPYLTIGNFSNDGSKLLMYSGKDSISVVDPRTGTIIQTINAPEGMITPDGQYVVATRTNPLKLAVYSIANGNKIRDLTYTPSANKYFSRVIGFTGTNGVKFFIQDMDGTKPRQIIIWNYLNDSKISEVAFQYSMPYGSNTGGAYYFSTDASISGFSPSENTNVIMFQNTLTGSLLTGKTFTMSTQTGIGISNDSTFVSQPSVGGLSPTIYNIISRQPVKVLDIPSQGTYYNSFSSSNNCQYIAGFHCKPGGILSSIPVRVWKVK